MQRSISSQAASGLNRVASVAKPRRSNSFTLHAGPVVLVESVYEPVLQRDPVYCMSVCIANKSTRCTRRHASEYTQDLTT